MGDVLMVTVEINFDADINKKELEIDFSKPINLQQVMFMGYGPQGPRFIPEVTLTKNTLYIQKLENYLLKEKKIEAPIKYVEIFIDRERCIMGLRLLQEKTENSYLIRHNGVTNKKASMTLPVELRGLAANKKSKVYEFLGNTEIGMVYIFAYQGVIKE